MEGRKIESLDEAIDELLSLGYLRYAEPDRLLEVTEDETPEQNAIAAWNRRTQNIGKKECCAQEGRCTFDE